MTAISAAGHADVLVSHDCPAGVQHDFGRLPAGWAAADLVRSDGHRQRLQQLMDAVQPRHVVHGHLHRAYQRGCDFGYGPVQVTGLAADGRLRSFAVLDVAAMRWERRDGLLRRAQRRPGRHRG